MNDFVSCTSRAARTQHLAERVRVDAYVERLTMLCGSGRAQTQGDIDKRLFGARHRTITDLPMCKRCEKTAGQS